MPEEMPPTSISQGTSTKTESVNSNLSGKMPRSSQAVEESLIYAVYKRRPLWDPSVHFYRNNTVVKLLWEEVAQETGLTDVQAKSRWKSLRDYYRIELKKIQKAGGEGSKKPAWIYFQPMSFLEELMSRKKSLLSKDSGESDESLSAGEESMEAAESLLAISANKRLESDESNMVSNERVKYDNTIKLEHQEIMSDRTEAVDSVFTSSRESAMQLSTRNPLKIRPSFDIVHKKMIYHLENRRLELLERSCKMDDDSDLLFFRSLVPLVKTLSESKRMRLRLKIQEIVCNEIDEQSKAT